MTAELPGVIRDDVSVSLQDEVLTLEGSRASTRKRSNGIGASAPVGALRVRSSCRSGSARSRSRRVTGTAVSRPSFVPAADIYENSDSLVVLCEMPGVASDRVDITLKRRVLTIRGRSGEYEHSGYQRVYTEYTAGDYERVFRLSEDIDNGPAGCG